VDSTTVNIADNLITLASGNTGNIFQADGSGIEVKVTTSGSPDNWYIKTFAEGTFWDISHNTRINGNLTIQALDSYYTGTITLPATSGIYFGGNKQRIESISNSTLDSLYLKTDNDTALTLDKDQNATFAGNVKIGSGTAPSGSTTDLFLASSIPMIELQDSDDNTYSRVYHSAGRFQIDVDRGNGGSGSYFQVKLDDSASKVLYYDETKLDVGGIIQITTASGTHPAIRFQEGSNTRAYLGSGDWAVTGLNDDDFGISASYTGDFAIATAFVNRFHITNTGYIGLGNQTSPLAKLDIKGSTDTFDGQAKIYLTDSNSNSSSRNWSIGNGGSGHGHLRFSVSAAKDGNAGDGSAATAMYIDKDSVINVSNVIQFNGQANCSINQFSNDLILRSHDDMYLQSKWIRLWSGPGSTNSTSSLNEYARISYTGNWFTGPMSFGGNNSGSSFGSSSNPGVAGQVLVSQGPTTAPTWANASGLSGVGGAWTTVSEIALSASNTGSSSWQNFSLSVGEYYRFTFVDLGFTGFNDKIGMRFSPDGGSSWQTMGGSRSNQQWSSSSWATSTFTTSSYFQTMYSDLISGSAFRLTTEILLFVPNGKGAIAMGQGMEAGGANLPVRHQFKVTGFVAQTTNYVRFQPHNYGNNSGQAWTGYLKAERWVT